MGENSIGFVYEIGDIERRHAEILKRISVLCRTGKDRGTGRICFTDESKLIAIENELQDSPYHKILDGDISKMYAKVSLEDLPKDCILISGHVDMVDYITVASSHMDESTGFYSGTYDNCGPNAAMVIMMLEENLPDNVVFAFTGDEETGRCAGAREAVDALLKAGKHPFCMALDVTYEGFYDSKLMTIENIFIDNNNATREKALEKFGHLLMELEPGDAPSFEYVPHRMNQIPSNLPQKFLSKERGMLDEAQMYERWGFPTFSLCLPCSGSMHSNVGVKVKIPVFEGYLLGLSSLAITLSEHIRDLFYDTGEIESKHTGLIESYKIARANLQDAARKITLSRYKAEAAGDYREETAGDYRGFLSKFFFSNDDSEYAASYLGHDDEDEQSYSDSSDIVTPQDVQDAKELFENYEMQLSEKDVNNIREQAEKYTSFDEYVSTVTIPDGIYKSLGMEEYITEDDDIQEMDELIEALQELQELVEAICIIAWEQYHLLSNDGQPTIDELQLWQEADFSDLEFE